MGLVQSNVAESDGDIIQAKGFSFRVHSGPRELIEHFNHVVVCFGYGKASVEPEFLVVREDMFVDWAGSVGYSTDDGLNAW